MARHIDAWRKPFNTIQAYRLHNKKKSYTTSSISRNLISSQNIRKESFTFSIGDQLKSLNNSKTENVWSSCRVSFSPNNICQYHITYSRRIKAKFWHVENLNWFKSFVECTKFRIKSKSKESINGLSQQYKFFSWIKSFRTTSS